MSKSVVPSLTVNARVVLCALVAAGASVSTPADSGKVIKLQNGGFLTYATRGQQTLLTFKGFSGPLKDFALKRDKDVAPQSHVKYMKIVGEINRSVLVLNDAYYSTPGSMQFCQAGDETFLRVVALRPEPKVTFEKNWKAAALA